MKNLSTEQISCYQADGFLILPGFANDALIQAMHRAAVDIAQRSEAGNDIADALIQPEARLSAAGLPLAERTSKIFRVHRREAVFRSFAMAPGTTQIVADILGPDLDCFLSQFIFKQPTALGQPWHQDAFYFPFEGPHQVGLWLAITEARLDNGPLWVLPGSHQEPVHSAVKDSRVDANPFYFEIIDHDMSAAIPVLLEAGDLLIFDSHLMHKSTDNNSDDLRAAMVYHYATPGTIDNSEAIYGRKPANQDWMAVLRDGQQVSTDA